MAATLMSDLSDGPVLSLVNKRIRALRKKHNRITQMEDSLAQGKTLNSEQEEVMRSKPVVLALIDELEKLRRPLSVAVNEELDIALQTNQAAVPSQKTDYDSVSDNSRVSKEGDKESETGEAGVKGESTLSVVEDLLQLLYFGTLFDVKPQSEYTSMMLTRTHERGCCLTYDYVTDDATDLLGEHDLDLISTLGGLLTSRPLNSSLPHKIALERCIEHAKLWLSKSNQNVNSESPFTYSSLREKLNKIMASYYFTATPEIKDPVEMAAAAAAGNYDSFQMPVHGSTESQISVSIEGDGSVEQYLEKDKDAANFEELKFGNNAHLSAEKEESDAQNVSNPSNPPNNVNEAEKANDQNLQQRNESQLKGNQRSYPNQRGRGNRMGYSSNPRGGGRGARGGGNLMGPYQNARNHQYYNQPGGNYFPKNNYYNNNNYNYRGRGGRGGAQYYYNSGDVGIAS